MGRRALAIIFLIGGILLLLLVLFFVRQDDGQVDVEQDPGLQVDVGDDLAPIGGEAELQATAELVEVVVSLQTVQRGWQMTEAELTTDLRRAEVVSPNALTDLDEAIGKYARTDIFQGETLTEDALVDDPTLIGLEEYGPSSLIPEGFVAQAIPIGRLSSVAYGLDEGDLVDVLVTFYISEIDEEFESLLENSAAFIIESVAEGEEGAEVQRSVFILDPFGRFETLPDGRLALIEPSEERRPLRVSFVLQAAKVIQVGPWRPPEQVAVPTATPTPDPAATPTPEAGVVPTATPVPPDVLLVALTPQQQLVLKYAVEVVADIDMALRPPNDTQIYGVNTMDLSTFLQRFNIEPPIDFGFTAKPVLVTVTPTPAPEGN